MGVSVGWSWARGRATWVIALLALTALWLAIATPAAHADGSPDISATVTSRAVLYGAPVPVTVSAANPAGQPYGYNLSFRVVLPAGVTYAGGAPVAPSQLADEPARGETTLLFTNVSDLSPNSSHDLDFDLSYSQTTYDAGDTFPVVAQAFLNSDPRYVPKFTATGVGDGGGATSYTGSTAEITGTQTLRAIEVTKDEPSPEGEIVRGVHDDQTTYTVTVRDNGVNPTSGTTLDDYLPAGLEFLGCGGANVDNTTDSPSNPGSPEEYPGSGPIVVAPLTGCVAPRLVETVDLDPDGAGPMASAVYTHVEWDVGTLAANGVRTFTYRAGVPLRANTTTFTNPPTGTLGEEANLDNNSGPEVTDETALDNYATAAGTYQGRVPTAASDSTILHRTAEDWAVQKTASSATLAEGGLTRWTLNFETSEYKFVDNATVTDTVPSGLCPLAETNLATQNDLSDSECDPTGDAANDPSQPYATATENADGTFTVGWDGATFARLLHTAVDDRFTITYWTRTRSHYQANFLPTTPILTRDTVANSVATNATDFARCVGATPDCSGGGAKIFGEDDQPIVDASGDQLIAGDPAIAKKISSGGTDCQTADYVTTVPHYHPGDRICWEANVAFPASLDTQPQALQDFLPADVAYDPGSDAALPDNTVTSTTDESAAASDGLLSWDVTGATVPSGSLAFDHVFSTTADPTGTIENGDVVGNLLKFSSTNTDGLSVPLRDEADFVLDTPTLAIAKSVASITGDVATGAGPAQIEAGDHVNYQVTVTNNGAQDAANVEVWDQLPVDYRCLGGIDPASLTGPSETCETGTTQDHIRWVVPAIPANGSVTLTYTAIVPTDIGADRTLTNNVGVRQYQGATNLGGFFTYTPSENIDPTDTTTNVDPVLASADVHTATARLAKSATTSVTEGGNSATQATVGETITYTVTATIPEGTTLPGTPIVSDLLDDTARQTYVADSASATVNGTPLPDGDIDTSGAVPSLTLDSPYVNLPGTGDDTVVLTFSTVVADAARNQTVSNGARTSPSLTDRASMAWTDPLDGAETATSNTVSTPLVEPKVSQTKTDDTTGDVAPGDVVTYTLTTRDATGSDVSTAHDLAITDTVPVGLTPVGGAPGNAPLADGDVVPGTSGAVWNAGARTISKTVTSIAPGDSDVSSYRVQVDDPAIGGARLSNTVGVTAASLPAADTGRRTFGNGYSASAGDTIQLGGATVTKDVSPRPDATIGDPLTYTLTVTIPANLSLFDTTVTDVLPDSLAFDGYGTETCVSGCPLVNPVNEYTPVTGGTGTTTVAWDLGDVATPLLTPQVISIAYRAHVRATHANGGAPVLDTQTAVNSATVGSDTTDRVGPFDASTIPTTFDDSDGPATTTTTIVEPSVAIDKRVSVDGGTTWVDGPVGAQSNTPLSYELVVTNSGDAGAHDVAVTDQPDGALANVVLAPQSGVTVTDDWTAGDPAIGWSIDTIPAGGSVTLTYTASLVPAGGLSDGQTVDNTAAVPHYFAEPAATRAADPGNYRDYTDGGQDSAEVTLGFPTFTTVKTTGLSGDPDTGTAQVDQDFPWQIVVTNSSTATATDVHATDVLPPNWAYRARSATIDGSRQEPAITTAAGGDQLDWTIASLAPGASATIAYDATPLPDAATTPGLGARANVNSASVTSARDASGNSGDADGPYGSAADTATATLEVPSLTIAKTPDDGAATAGTLSSFTIVVGNTGTATAHDLDVSDLLPAGLTYTAGSATATPATGFSETLVAAGPGSGQTTVHWGIASLAAGDTVTLTVPVAVASDVPDGTTLTNDAGVSSDEQPDAVTDTGSLDVAATANVSIEKSGLGTYTPGTPYTWHLRVQNAGPSDAQGVSVRDPLPAGVTFRAADAPCTATGRSVTCALGTLPAGFDHTYDVTADVDPATTTSPLANTATVTTTTTDSNPRDDSSTFGPTAAPLADVSLAKTVSPTAVLKGQQTTFTLTAHNAGPSTARTVVLTDPLPAQLSFVSADGTGCANAAGMLTCPLGDLAPGANAVVHVVALTTTDGEWTNTASVSTTTDEPVGGGDPNSASAAVTVGPVADLALTKAAPATVAAGGQLTWTLAVTNHGPDDATGVTITDPLPAGVAFVSADPGCTYASGTLTCAVGDLANGATATRQVTVTVPIALADSTLINNATVSGDQGDDRPTDEVGSAETQVGPSADLAIAKSGPATANADGTIAWTLVATDGGPSPATGVEVGDTLPAGATLVSVTPSQGSCGVNGQAVACALGTLANGGAAQIQVVAHLAPSLAGTTLRNGAMISGQQPDPNPANNAASATTAIGDPAPADYDLALAKRVAAPAKPALGQRLRYALTVTNHGPAAAAAVRLTDTLPSTLSFVSASVAGGSCAHKGQVVTCTLRALAAGAARVANVTVVPQRAGKIVNTATVGAAVADQVAANNRASATTTVTTPRAVLRVVKTTTAKAALLPGAQVRFRIRVTNASKAAVAAGVVVCDRLPSTLTYVAFPGARLRGGNACWNVGLLAAGASRTVTVVARVDGDAKAGTIRNTALATAENAADARATAAIRVKLPSGGGVEGVNAHGGGVTG